MGTIPPTDGFDTAIPNAAVEVTAAPGAGLAIEVEFQEISTKAAGKAILHFGADTPADRVAGGHLAAGGGSAPLRRTVTGPLNTALNYTSDITGDQTVVVRSRIVRPGSPA